MHVLGENRAGVNDDAGLLDHTLKADADGHRLSSGEPHGRIEQRLFRRRPKGGVVRHIRDGSPMGNLRRGTERQQRRAADVRGIRPARVIGKPEAVRAEDDVVGEDHPRTR